MVYTDYTNLTYKTHNSVRLMRWQITVEEFGTELIYLPRDNNIVADSLNRLHLQNLKNTDSRSSVYACVYACVEHFVLDKNYLPPHANPLNYNTIVRHQQNDADLINPARSNSAYILPEFPCANRVRKLICLNGKIVIPKTLQKHLVQWYHTFLCQHPGETRTEQTIRKHFKCTQKFHSICKKLKKYYFVF